MVRYLLVMTVLLAGCHYNLTDTTPPFRSPQPHTTEDGVSIKITPVKNIGDKNVSRYLTVFYIDIKNSSDKSIMIERSGIVLVDQYKKQYNQVAPEYAADIIRENSTPRIYPRISVGIGTGYFSDYGYFHGYHDYWHYRRFPYYHDDFYYGNYYYTRENLDYIYKNAFIPGTVQPGASLSGFVYFNKVPDHTENITLYINYETTGTDMRKEIGFEISR